MTAQEPQPRREKLLEDILDTVRSIDQTVDEIKDHIEDYFDDMRYERGWHGHDGSCDPAVEYDHS